MPTASRLVWRRRNGSLSRHPDELAVEEPLEIRLTSLPASRPETVSVTMRTPGSDFELAAGFLLSEGILEGPADVAGIRYCTDEDLDDEQRFNVVTVDLTPAAAGRLAERGGVTARLTPTSASCGVCGSKSIEALTDAAVRTARTSEREAEGCFSLGGIASWPELLRVEGQSGFDATGGLHAAGLVSSEGHLLVAREDIGRHNAVDKVGGWALLEALEGRRPWPVRDAGLVVSGRSSFEIVQKAVRIGVPVVAAVSAASSLAARLADETGVSLLGFVRDGGCTVYTHPERLDSSA